MKPGAMIVLVLLFLPGCRSDGGVGRQDSGRGMAFSTRAVANRFQTDCRRTSYLFSSIPSAFENSMTKGPENMRNTYYLYLENHEAR